MDSCVCVCLPVCLRACLTSHRPSGVVLPRFLLLRNCHSVCVCVCVSTSPEVCVVSWIIDGKWINSALNYCQTDCVWARPCVCVRACVRVCVNVLIFAWTWLCSASFFFFFLGLLNASFNRWLLLFICFQTWLETCISMFALGNLSSSFGWVNRLISIICAQMCVCVVLGSLPYLKKNKKKNSAAW